MKHGRTNPHLKAAILEVVENQLSANDPPETHLTLERLMTQGYSESEAKKLIGCIVTAEIFDVLKSRKPFDPARYRAALAKLPQLPGD